METQKEPGGFLEKNPAGNPEETQQVTQGTTQNVTQSETETEPRNNPERKLTRHQTLRQRYQEDLGGSSGGSLPCAHTHARGDAWADPPAPLATPELRDYQHVAVDGLRDAIRGGARLPVLQAGTGAGKTIMAAEVIRSSQGKGKFCVFLAHRRELVHQASDKLTRFGVAHGIVMAGEQPLARHTQVASIQTLTSRWTRRGEEPPPADLVVIDECHRATARTYRQLIDWYRERGAVVLGLTATPIRTDGTGLGDVFDAMVCCPSLKSLTDDGHLVPARFYAPTNPDLTGVQVRRGDYVDGDLEGVMDRPQLVGDIVTHWLRHAADRKTVVFATSVRHSAHLAEEFRKSGVAAEHLDGETPKDERDAILRSLSDGDLQVVTNCEVLCEGWDQPDVSCLVLARPTKSPVRYLQMVGRVLRSHPGKVDALVLDHAGCVHEHGFPVEFDDWALEKGTAQHPNKTQRERQKREAKVIVCEQCFASYTGSPKCPECGHVRQVKGRDVAYIDGDLGEVKRKGSAEKVEASRGDKQRWWGELLGIAGERGYQRGWASHKYRERFGVWPRGLADVSRPPSPEVRRWVKSRQIAWAKAQQKGAAA